MSLSVVLITKNEEKSLERALESVLKNEQAMRQAAIGKETDLRDTTRIYFEAAVARGANPKDPRTMEAARRQAYQDIGLAQQRVNVQEQGLTNAQVRQAMDSTEKDLKQSTNRLEMLKRQEADAKNGTNTADQFREQLYQDNLRRAMGGGGRPAPAAAEQPAAKPTAPAKKPTIESVRGAPAGAKIGNAVEGKGYEVLDKNGKVIGYAR
jgi:DNA-binding transcriptional MerR regulator